MTEEEIFAKIAKIIAERFELPEDKVTNDLNFQNDLNADSMILLSLSWN